MRIFFRILAIILALSVFGNLIAGKVFIIGIILTALFAYLGWGTNTTETAKNDTKPNLITETHTEFSEFRNNFSVVK